MGKWGQRLIIAVPVLIGVALIGFHLVLPRYFDAKVNATFPHEPYPVSDDTAALHRSLTIMDWHADSFLWTRDIRKRHSYGHVDIPRLQDANVALQMFTTVTKSPRGQNFDRNTGDTDNITILAVAQGWPSKTWDSLLERALYQARRLNRAVETDPSLMWVRNKAELAAVLEARAAYGEAHTGGPWTPPIGALLGAEGAHPLEAEVENIDVMYDAGFRMLGLTHFFDNALGGSLHGISNAGLTDFGRAAVDAMDKKGIIIDLAHASETVVAEVLDRVTRPVVVSHTGFKGHTNSPRNISDHLMKRIADAGGLLSVAFFAPAIANPPTPDAIADAIIYGMETFGVGAIALGSDWDGSVITIRSDEIAAITEALRTRGVSDADIRAVMGGNSVRFLETWLPDA